ncbi:chymotrypsin B-like [Phymastichus coffea]|uniref:chymotrypsin B-like n=1 Tax=Phymastichus coffea TaxID=108790 RepID=UPI00273B11EA|nr:chymotrypsin B-like [Phymastichus coffea]
MYQTIYFYIIQQLLLFTAKVEPLSGQKIVEANDLEFPFMASIQDNNGYHLCSGVLITNHFVITVKHCLESEILRHIRIAFGMTDLQQTFQRCKISGYYTYDDWAARLHLSEGSDTENIAMVKLVRQPLNAVPVHLSKFNKQQVQGKMAMILGWTRRQNAEQLTKGIVKILKNEDCSKMMHRITNKNFYISSKTICTFAEPYVLLENGDLGGPLLDQDGDLLGINLYCGPGSTFSWGNFTDDFIQKYEVNHHVDLTHHNLRRFVIEISLID